MSMHVYNVRSVFLAGALPSRVLQDAYDDVSSGESRIMQPIPRIFVYSIVLSRRVDELG